MNPRAKNLPKHWQEWVEAHPDLGAGQYTPDFNHHVFIKWEDGSTMHFTYAFIVKDEHWNEIAVFTEHCGYYCFSGSSLDEYGMYSRKKIEVVNGS